MEKKLGCIDIGNSKTHVRQGILQFKATTTVPSMVQGRSRTSRYGRKRKYTTIKDR